VGSLEKVAQAKCELLQVMGKEGIAVLNGDDETLLKAAEKYPCRRVTFGFGANCDVRLSDEEFPSTLAAPFQKANALAVLAVARLLDIPQEGALGALSQWSSLKGRLEVKKGNGFWLIDDTYNANPLSMRVALEFLRDFQTSGKRVAILSDMLELGSQASLWHYRLGQQVACFGLDHLILLGEFASQVQKGAQERGMKETSIDIVGSHQEIVERVSSKIGLQDVLLVKGSRLMKMETVVEGLLSNVLSSGVSIT
jgi:UDP-N-acetylmuramoyl-tripeptide--D-alanyl-D-alanine ligase